MATTTTTTTARLGKFAARFPSGRVRLFPSAETRDRVLAIVGGEAVDPPAGWPAR